ncbi:hypothetical protein ACRRTK_021655 [Alexandromys fortis]
MPALTEPPVLYEEVSTTVVTTTASEAVLALAAILDQETNKNEALQFTTTLETYGELVCGLRKKPSFRLKRLGLAAVPR